MSEPGIDKRISATRQELETTLDEIGDKLNVKKQAGILGRKARAAFDENPVPFIAGATALVIAVGGLVAWAVLGRDD